MIGLDGVSSELAEATRPILTGSLDPSNQDVSLLTPGRLSCVSATVWNVASLSVGLAGRCGEDAREVQNGRYVEDRLGEEALEKSRVVRDLECRGVRGGGKRGCKLSSLGVSSALGRCILNFGSA